MKRAVYGTGFVGENKVGGSGAGDSCARRQPEMRVAELDGHGAQFLST
jgi:hypothetical protein